MDLYLVFYLTKKQIKIIQSFIINHWFFNDEKLVEFNQYLIYAQKLKYYLYN